MDPVKPTVRITDAALNRTLDDVELMPSLIEMTPQGCVYRGEMAGAILLPAQFWVSP
jgi:hypothetical protein